MSTQASTLATVHDDATTYKKLHQLLHVMKRYAQDSAAAAQSCVCYVSSHAIADTISDTLLQQHAKHQTLFLVWYSLKP